MYCRSIQTRACGFLLLWIYVSHWSLLCKAMKQCSTEEGGGFCPDGSKCCKMRSRYPKDDKHKVESGCIPNSNHYQGHGSCCSDDDHTACPGNYQCSRIRIGPSRGERRCILKSYINEENPTNPKGIETVEERILPRYNLISVPSRTIGNIYGFPLSGFDLNPVGTYYSNHGPILTTNPFHITRKIRVAILIIHGSDRNADEYLYSAMTTSHLQKKYATEEILYIAPRFLAFQDQIYSVPVEYKGNNHTVPIISMMQCLLWNETYPVPHTWRYGGNAQSPFEQVSSYDVVDQMVDHLMSSGYYTALEKVVVAGHSAGGQLVQRWAMMSNIPSWNTYSELEWMKKVTPHGISIKQSRTLSRLTNAFASISAVVANPRSFCYLDGRRILEDQTYQIPPSSLVDSCPTYNTWEWGLEDGGLPSTFRDKTLSYFHGNRKMLAERYAQRHVIYLSGANDTETLYGSCEEDWFQGSFRRERSEKFYDSLKMYFGRQVHDRLVVEDCGHDHMIMFQSTNGLVGLYGNVE